MFFRQVDGLLGMMDDLLVIAFLRGLDGEQQCDLTLFDLILQDLNELYQLL